MNIKISEDENTIEVDGLIYIAVKSSGFRCLGCDLIPNHKHKTGLCKEYPCNVHERKDGKCVLFKRKY